MITRGQVRLGVGRQQSLPRITQKDDTVYLADCTAGTRAVYKYFDLSRTRSIRINYQGTAVITVNGRQLDGNGTAPVSGGAKESLTMDVLSGKADIVSFTLLD